MSTLCFGFSSQKFLVRKSVLLFSVFLILLGISTILAIRKTSAFSMDLSVSFEVANYGLRLYVEKVRNSSSDLSLQDLGTCAGGVFSGDYFGAGQFEVSFYGANSRRLGCGNKLSDVAFVRCTSFYRGLSSVVQQWVGVAGEGGQKFSCTGSRPSNTKVYDNDDAGLTSNVSWKYSEENTESKCEYVCRSGYVWNGSECKEATTIPSPPLKNVAYKGSLALDVYPATGGNANAPVLLFLHSGGWFKGDKTDDAARFGESLSAQGITVVAPNYTLVPDGYYPAPLFDTDCALRWIVAHASQYKFSVENISLGGYSSGGHITLLYSLNSVSYRDTSCSWNVASPLLKRVVSLAGPTNFATLTGDVRDMAFNFLHGASSAEASPLSYASNKNASEYLLFQARDDELVSFSEQAVPFYNALLTWTPLRVQAKWYDTGGHLFAYDNSTPIYRDVIQNIRAFLAP